MNSELDLDMLKSSSSMYANLLFPKVKKFSYSKSNIYLGTGETGGRVSISLKKSYRIAILGRTECGKTRVMRGIMDRAFRAGVIPVILGDMKPNFYTSVDPIPKDEARLMKHEKPAGLPLKIYYPNFFGHLLGTKLPFDHYPLNFSLKDLNVNDFMSLLTIDLRDSQRVLIESIWEKYDDANELIGAIANADAFGNQTKVAVINALSNIMKYELIGNDNHDIINDINMGKIPVLCLAGEGDLGEHKHFMTTYVSILLRKIMSAARRGQLKKRILLVLDELPRWCPMKGGGQLKETIIECYSVGREWGISIVASAQFFTQIPPIIFGQSRYILLAHNIGDDSMAEVFKKFSITLDCAQNMFKHEVREIINSMELYSNGDRDWMLVDQDKKSYKIFVAFSPLSRHKHEART